MTDERPEHDDETGRPDAEPSPRLVEGIEALEGEQLLDQEGIDSLLGQLSDGGAVAGGGAREFSLPEVEETAATGAVDADGQIELLKDVNVKVKVELGRGAMYLREILKLGQGSVVELDKLAGDPLDIYVNERLIAKGEVLVLNENFCIRVTEIFSPREVLRLKG